MILEGRGSIFDSKAQMLVNPVNCRGVSGRGLALEFKRLWPAEHESYRVECVQGRMRPGNILIQPTGAVHSQKFIVYFPTKDDWRNPSRLEWIRNGLGTLHNAVTELEISSVAIPALGCGLGGLPWAPVREAISIFAHMLPGVRIEVYPPKGIKAGLHDEGRLIEFNG